MSSNNPQEDPKPSPAVLSQELESFRRQWKEDLKTHKPEGAESASRKAGPSQPAATAGAASTAGKSRAESHTHRRRLSQQSARDELRGQAATAAVRKQLDHLDDGAQSHDLEVTIAKSTLLEDPSGGRVLGTSAPREPATALDYYEDAVEQERAGRQDEGLRLYRRAFKVRYEYQSPAGKTSRQANLVFYKRWTRKSRKSIKKSASQSLPKRHRMVLPLLRLFLPPF